MTDKDILISDLNDISEILNNNGYGGWCGTIRKAVALLKEQDELIRKLQKDKDKLCLDVSEWKHKYHDRPLKEQEQIVRCKDCKYSLSNSRFCAYPHKKNNIQPCDWFCADGVKRDE